MVNEVDVTTHGESDSTHLRYTSTPTELCDNGDTTPSFCHAHRASLCFYETDAKTCTVRLAGETVFRRMEILNRPPSRCPVNHNGESVFGSRQQWPCEAMTHALILDTARLRMLVSSVSHTILTVLRCRTANTKLLEAYSVQWMPQPHRREGRPATAKVLHHT